MEFLVFLLECKGLAWLTTLMMLLLLFDREEIVLESGRLIDCARLIIPMDSTCYSCCNCSSFHGILNDLFLWLLFG
jgi:hypothetical protein